MLVFNNIWCLSSPKTKSTASRIWFFGKIQRNIIERHTLHKSRSYQQFIRNSIEIPSRTCSSHGRHSANVETFSVSFGMKITTKSLVEYRMCAHVFGNSPSPTIATYGLRKTVKISKESYGDDVTHFVCNDFYVDDGLTSLPTSDMAIDLMKRTQSALKTMGNLRLHKIVSNSEEVMKAFLTVRSS